MRLFLLLALAATAGCSSKLTYRYRLTVDVETPTGMRSGSSVIEIESRKVFRPLSGGTCDGQRVTSYYEAHVRGEAVAIDLGNGRMIYALLQSPSAWSAQDYPLAAYREAIGRHDLCPSWPEERARHRILRAQTAPAELPNPLPRHDGTAVIFPTIVRFADPNNPHTVQVLDSHDLARDIGPGYRLLRATIALTDDPVTEGIERRLPWLRTLTGSLQPYAPPPSRIREPERVLTAWAFLSR